MNHFKKLTATIVACAMLISSMVSLAYLEPVTAATEPPATSSDANGLVLSKRYDGQKTLYLEAYATGTKVTKPLPADTVIVLDISTSMDTSMTVVENCDNLTEALAQLDTTYGASEGVYTINTGYADRNMRYSDGKWQWYYVSPWLGIGSGYKDITTENADKYNLDFSNIETSRMDALKIAAIGLVNAFAADAKKNNVEHAVSIVTFGASATTLASNLSVLNNQTNVNTLINAIKGVSATSSTTAQSVGLDAAYNIITASNRVSVKNVILVSDGAPAASGSNWTASYADNGVKSANKIKAYKFAGDYDYAKVWSVGILEEGDTYYSNADKFLCYVSSNHNGGTSYSNPGTHTDAGYYQNAKSATGLTNIVGGIVDEIVEIACTLDTSAVVVDEITKYFKVPEGFTKDDVRVYTADWNGATFGEKKVFTDAVVSVTHIDGATEEDGIDRIEVSNFDFSKNACVEGVNSGKKLIIEIDIEPSSVAINPNDTENITPVYDPHDPTVLLYYEIKTNTAKSGVYQNEDQFEFGPVEAFDIPETVLYSVVYKDYNGTVIKTYEGLRAGDATPVLPDADKPSREGYVFNGWSPEISPTVLAADDDDGDCEIIYTATYVDGESDYAIEYYLEDPTSNDVIIGDIHYKKVKTEEKKGATNSTVDITNELPTYNGYELDEENSVLSGTVAVTPELVLKSFFNKKVYSVTYKDGYNPDGSDVVAKYDIKHGDNIQKPADPTRNGYHFTGWNVTLPSTVNGDITAVATWEKTYYTVRVFNGTVNPVTGKVSYDHTPTTTNKIYCEEVENFLDVTIDPAEFITYGTEIDTNETKRANPLIFTSVAATASVLRYTINEDSTTVVDYYLKPFIITIIHEHDNKVEYFPGPTDPTKPFDITEKIEEGKLYGGIKDEDDYYITDENGKKLDPGEDKTYVLVEIDRNIYNYCKFIVVSRPETGSDDGNGKEIKRITDIYAILTLPSTNFLGYGVNGVTVLTEEEELGENAGSYTKFAQDFDISEVAEAYTVSKDGKTVSITPANATAGEGDVYGVFKLNLNNDETFLTEVKDDEGDYNYFNEIVFRIRSFWITPDNVKVSNRINVYGIAENSKRLTTVGIITTSVLCEAMASPD